MRRPTQTWTFIATAVTSLLAACGSQGPRAGADTGARADSATPVAASAGAGTASRAAAAPSDSLTITRGGSRLVQQGPAEQFTGAVRVEMLFAATDSSRAAGASVSFAPGSRTAWHRHPRGQVLVVTAGAGRVQRRGGPVEEIRAGDVVWTPPNVEHWHGAASDTAMQHIAIQEALDGKTVEWLEHVTDAQYRGAPD